MIGIGSAIDKRLWIAGRGSVMSTVGWAVVFRGGHSVEETRRIVQAYLNRPIFLRSDKCHARTESPSEGCHAESVRPLGHTRCVGCQSEGWAWGFVSTRIFVNSTRTLLTKSRLAVGCARACGVRTVIARCFWLVRLPLPLIPLIVLSPHPPRAVAL